MRFFPKLGERTIRLRIGGGMELEVRKLSVLDYDRLNEMIRDTERESTAGNLSIAEKAAILEKGGRRICDLLAPYFSGEVSGDLFRLGYAGLIELGMYMAFGSNFEVPPDGSKKN